jgi:IS5 family transposase
MKQHTFSDLEYANRRRQTKRENFLNSMNTIIPWSQWVEMVRPHYPKGDRGRKPREIETMLRMYLLQNWFNLSDEGIEDAIYDSYAIRTFMGIDFLKEQAPDATTLLHFRHLIEDNGIAKLIFDDVRDRLDKAGLLMHGGTVVDATIVAAPSSTKNQSGERDPEMHQTKKGNEWHFGMKIHSGVDAGSGYVHTITATSANEHDITETAKLVREDDAVVYGDSGYLGIEKREDIKSDNNLRQVDFRINKRPSQNQITAYYKGTNWDKQIENRKSSTRCKVEHPYLIVKRQFGYSKVSYRGIAKNLNRFFMLFASANLVMCIRAGRQTDFCGV